MLTRRCTATALAFATAMGSAQAAAAPTCDDSRDALVAKQVKRWVDEQAPASKPTVVLMFNHPTGKWRARRLWWRGISASVERPTACGDTSVCLGPDVDVDLQLNNTARVALRSGGRDRLVVAVTDTNPLLYTVDRALAKDSEAPDIADLATFATAFSGTALAAITLSGSRERTNLNARAEAAAANVQAPQVQIATATPRGEGTRERERAFAANAAAAAARAKADLLAILAAVDTKVRDASEEAAREHSPLSAFKDAAGQFETAIAGINNGERALTRLVMAAEQDQELARSDLRVFEDITEDGVRQALEALLAARAKLEGFQGLACAGVLADVTSALNASVLAACDCPSKCEAQNQWQAALDRLSTTKTCVDLLGGLVATLRRFPPCDPVFKDPDVSLAVQTVIDDVAEYAALAAARKEALDKSKNAADGQTERESRAAALRVAAKEARELWDLDGECALRRGVLIVNETDGTAQWDQLGQRGFKVAVREARAKNVQRRLGTLEASYEIASRRLLHMTVGFGPIFTKLANPSWTAVQDPADERGLVIGRADEATRAGRVAAFLTLYPDKLYKAGPQFGFDIGVATNSVETPAVFLGASVGWRELRVSTGFTWQRVKKLASDQRELLRNPDGTFSTDATVVASKDDIRTRDGVDRAWYVAAIVNLSSLPFFK